LSSSLSSIVDDIPFLLLSLLLLLLLVDDGDDVDGCDDDDGVFGDVVEVGVDTDGVDGDGTKGCNTGGALVCIMAPRPILGRAAGSRLRDSASDTAR
jgi:hypothetical protein